MQAHNLIIYANTDAIPNSNAVLALHNLIQQHLDAHRLIMPNSPERTIAIPDEQSIIADFYHLPWKLVTIGYCKSYNNSGVYHAISNSSHPYHLVTWHELFSNGRSTAGRELCRLPNIEDRPLMFIGVYHGNG